MSWETRYLPPSKQLWQGRADAPRDSCIYQQIKMLDLLKETPLDSSDIAFAVLGFDYDEAHNANTNRTGAVNAPDEIKQRFSRLPLQKPITLYDAGNITCSDNDLEASQSALARAVSMLLKHNIRPLILGGGHELAWGHYQGIAHAYPKTERLGILNLDAHFDLYPIEQERKASAKTVFYQIAMAQQERNGHLDYNCIGIQHAANVRQQFEIAKSFNTKMILADEMHQGLQEKCFDFLDRIIDENDSIYVSLALDVFSQACAPGVSTSQPLGLSPWDIIPLIRQVAASNKVVSYDIAEYVPQYDIDHRTAKLAATLMYEIIHHHNEHSSIHQSNPA